LDEIVEETYGRAKSEAGGRDFLAQEKRKRPSDFRQADVAGGVVLQILTKIPPRQRLRGSGHLCRLTDVGRVVRVGIRDRPSACPDVRFSTAGLACRDRPAAIYSIKPRVLPEQQTSRLAPPVCVAAAAEICKMDGFAHPAPRQTVRRV